uniref:Uncharacterized protein n=1 Tax=Agarophyton chilense TaxID=2510777 RepID=O49035_AGACH|nr:ORF14 [Agarophyton chilense]
MIGKRCKMIGFKKQNFLLLIISYFSKVLIYKFFYLLFRKAGKYVVNLNWANIFF